MQKPEITIDRIGETVWFVGLTGEHDLATAPRLDESLTEIVRHGTEIVVDLSAATFLDSTIVGVLMKYGDLPGESLSVIAPPGGTPRRVLDLIGANELVPVYESREAALEAVGA